MATNGPLLFAEIDGHEPGSEINGRDSVMVSIDLHTIAPVEVIEIVVDGAIVHTLPVPKGQRLLTVRESVSVKGARWIAVRARGGPARYTGDNYTFAHTSPVYFTDAQPNDASRVSADFLIATIRAILRRADERGSWLNPEDKEAYQRHLEGVLSRLVRR